MTKPVRLQLSRRKGFNLYPLDLPAMSKELFTRDMFAKDGDDSGIFLYELGNAIVTFVAMRNAPVTVADVMAAFNTTREVVVEAVEEASWAFLSDDDCDDPTKTTIELDGA